MEEKSRNAAQNLALHRLELAEVESDREPGNDQLRRQLDLAKQEVEEFNRKAAEGAECRARIQWHVEGEKPTNFFCNLEKFNALQKYIPQLLVKQTLEEDYTLVNEQARVEKEIFKFYQNLYKSQESKEKIITIEDFLGPEEISKCPKIKNKQAEKLEGKLRVDEATRYIKKCWSDASPGSSGLTGAFYKFFWRNLKHFIVNSLNYAYETGNLSISQKLGVIILLPKPDKDKRFLTNWRPISLLNQVYKILSGALTERLKPVLESIIHTDQKGFVSGRYIGEVPRNTYDVLEYAKSRNRTGLLLLIDFEKAFDSISHSFIIKCLHFFGFGFSFIKLINVLLNDVSSCINHCGNISERFRVGRSCRQGDPISPYLFIICVEILAIKIRGDSQVKGFKIGNFEQKLDFYADDLTAYLDGSKTSLENIIEILDRFRRISGLKINLSKCKAVWIGRNRFSNNKICDNLNLIWTNKFRLLGIDFDSDLAKMDTNFENKLAEIGKLFKSWTFRHLSPFGRITIIKSLALSKLSHVAMVCPLLNHNILKDLKKMAYDFLWKNKPDRMKRCETELRTDKGGLNMPDIETFWLSLKLTWSRRLMAPSCMWQKILEANLLYCNHEITDIWFGGPTLLKKMSEKISNNFWKEIINTFATITGDLHFSHPYFFFNFNVFDNPLFSRGEMELKSSDFQSLWSKKICQVGDFFDRTQTPPRLLSLEQINRKYDIRLNFLNFHRLTNLIIKAANDLNNKIFDPKISDMQTPSLPLIHKLSCIVSKGGRIFYEALKARDWAEIGTRDYENKWQMELNTTFSLDFWNKIWIINKNSLVSNKMKWINLQILKFILPTNYSVNKYKPLQDPRCSFCTAHSERLPDLIWGCLVVRDFWKMVGNILTSNFPNFSMGRKEAIFGEIKSRGDSVINTVILLAKQFLWRQKFGSKNIDELQFILYMRCELRFLIKTMESKGKGLPLCGDWDKIFDHFNID